MKKFGIYNLIKTNNSNMNENNPLDLLLNVMSNQNNLDINNDNQNIAKKNQENNLDAQEQVENEQINNVTYNRQQEWKYKNKA